MKSRLSILRRTILFTLIMGVALLFLCTRYSFASEENDAGIILEKIGQSSSELPYRMIPDHSNKTYVIGDIRIKVSNRAFYYSEKAGKHFRKFLIGGGYDSVIANNDGAYYIVTNNEKELVSLYYLEFDSGKKNKVCTLKSGWTYPGMQDYWHFSHVNNNYIYFTKYSDADGYKTYCFDITMGKLKHKPVTGRIEDRSASHVVMLTRWHTDVSPDTLKLYEIQNNGELRLNSNLAKYGCTAGFNGKYYYYGSYIGYGKKNDYSMNRISLYRIRKDGTGKKRIKTIKEKTGNYICIDKIKSGKCYVLSRKYKYIINLRTGKMKKKRIS